jgi:hypothetical protein
VQISSHLTPTALARKSERALRIPVPTDPKHRRIKQSLNKQIAHGSAVQITEHIVERERMLGTEREHNRVVCSRSL